MRRREGGSLELAVAVYVGIRMRQYTIGSQEKAGVPGAVGRIRKKTA